jgi:hypothetical protein
MLAKQEKLVAPDSLNLWTKSREGRYFLYFL